MEKFIKIIRNPYEEPYHINLIFKASNGESCGQLEIYDNAEKLEKLADVLESFPFKETKTFLWELGSEKVKDNFAFYFKCEFSLIKHSSECVVGIRLNNNENGIEKSISEFYINCYPAELNKLGELFREFSKLEKETLTWNGLNGKVE
ncbi:hypothetical protein SHK09_15060 [Polaribacter sp. PL03]|uniref:hypothetical protein n=1 Tax=Polaribacter sp. PL03 TaxID=3088353 RepID=UPI0029CE6AB3|nr:hypothetical protein [Polaribacter sp. PL03]MDX6748115.1 hypothetical protein [Polaribacter sp. PL03]